MRVLHFLPVYVPAWQFGGPILSVSRLCEGLVQQGVDVRVITTNAGLPNFPIEQLGVPQRVNGVQVIYYPIDHAHGSIRSRALVDSLPAHMAWAELLHLSSIWQPLGLAVQEKAIAAGIPVVQTLRGALGPYSWTRSFLRKFFYFLLFERRLLQQASCIHCTTLQEINEIAWLRLRPRITLLPNPLDLDALYTDRDLGQEWRLKHNIPLTTTLFIVAGRLHHKKGLELLPKALQRISHHSWHLAILGDGDDRTSHRLRRSLREFGLSSRCHWFSSVPAADLLAPLNAADWLLLPSRHENFGNIVVEALACGCGAVISDRVGVSEMLKDCPGVLVGPRTSNAWSTLLAETLTLDRPTTLSESWVKQKFNQVSIAKQTQSLYLSLI